MDRSATLSLPPVHGPSNQGLVLWGCECCPCMSTGVIHIIAVHLLTFSSFTGSNQNIWQCTGLSHLGIAYFGKPSYLLITFMAALSVKRIAGVVCLHFALHSRLPIAGGLPFCLSNPVNIPCKWQRQWNDERSNLQTLGQIRAKLKCKSCILGLPLTAYLWVNWVRKTWWSPGLEQLTKIRGSEPKVSINIFKSL